MSRNVYMNLAKSMFKRVFRTIKDPVQRQDMEDGFTALDKADFLYEQWIQEAKMIGVRNPAFDGDMVGWLDDDFDEDDDERNARKGKFPRPK